MSMIGLAHLLFAFRGPRLLPRDPNLQRRMEEVSPVITRRTATALYVLGLVASHA